MKGEHRTDCAIRTISYGTQEQPTVSNYCTFLSFLHIKGNRFSKFYRVPVHLQKFISNDGWQHNTKKHIFFTSLVYVLFLSLLLGYMRFYRKRKLCDYTSENCWPVGVIE